MKHIATKVFSLSENIPTALRDLPQYYREIKRNRRYIEGLVYFKKLEVIPGIALQQNFGDYLSTIIVSELARRYGLVGRCESGAGKMLAVGSILHFAADGDTIWGTGINGKVPTESHRFQSLNVSMVRGPITADFLRRRGIIVPDCYGDPAVLLPLLFPRLHHRPVPDRVIFIPNLNDIAYYKHRLPEKVRLVSPLWHWTRVVKSILSAEVVLTSSLHGLIISEALGVPVRLYKPVGGETLLKFRDYLLGTGRDMSTEPASFTRCEDIRMGSQFPFPQINSDQMTSAFPFQLFR